MVSIMFMIKTRNQKTICKICSQPFEVLNWLKDKTRNIASQKQIDLTLQFSCFYYWFYNVKTETVQTEKIGPKFDMNDIK